MYFLFFYTSKETNGDAILLFFTTTEAARVRKEYEESNAKLSKLQSKISSLSQKLKHDFGRFVIRFHVWVKIFHS